MKQFVYPLALIIFLASCQGKRTTEEPSPDPAPPTVKQDAALRPEGAEEHNEPVSQDVHPVDCSAGDLFQDTLELPLEIDYDLLISVSDQEDKPIIPFQCVGDGAEHIVDGLPSSFYHPYGKILLNDSTELYLVITAMNPENPMDMYFVAASVYHEVDGRLEEEVNVAKYHAYSGTIEHVYCTIRKDGTVYQQFKQTAYPDGVEEVFNVGDTLFPIVRQ